MGRKKNYLLLAILVLAAGLLLGSVVLNDYSISYVGAEENSNIGDPSSGNVPRFPGGNMEADENKNINTEPNSIPDFPDEDGCDTDGCWVIFSIESAGSIISGQSSVTIDVQDTDAVDRFEISYWRNYSGTYILEAIEALPCLIDYNSELDAWIGTCDIMTEQNTTGRFYGLRAFDEHDQQVKLKHHSSNPSLPYGEGQSKFEGTPLFGPYQIRNTGAVNFIDQQIIREDLVMIRGDVVVEATVSGGVEDAYVWLTKLNYPQIEITDFEGLTTGNHGSLWRKDFWSSDQEEYYETWDINIRYHTDSSYPGNSILRDIHTGQQVIIVDTFIPPDGGDIDNPDIDRCNYICSPWSDCVNNTKIRSCTSSVGGADCPNYSEDEDCESGEEGDTQQSYGPAAVTVVEPGKQDLLWGNVTLTAKVEGEIQSLEFSRETAGTGTPQEFFTGHGYQISTNSELWEYSWDTVETPDGEYNIFARVVGKDGLTYISNKVLVTIDQSAGENIPSLPSESDDPTELTDADGDNVPDIIENEIGSDPNNADSDGDGVEDGEEIIKSLNPIGEGTLSKLAENNSITEERLAEIRNILTKIVFDEPIVSGTLRADKLKVLKVTNVIDRIGVNKLVFSGIGPDDRYLTLFIYSTPLVVTTKTDSSGNFRYILDKNLLDGKHEIYVTITDETGKIQEKSSPFTFFVSKARAVSEEEYLRGDVDFKSESTGIINNYMLMAVIIIGIALGIVITAYFISKKKPVKL